MYLRMLFLFDTVVDYEVSFGVEDEPDETIIKEIYAEMKYGEKTYE